jgi:hypothetical protein
MRVSEKKRKKEEISFSFQSPLSSQHVCSSLNLENSEERRKLK